MVKWWFVFAVILNTIYLFNGKFRKITIIKGVI